VCVLRCGDIILVDKKDRKQSRKKMQTAEYANYQANGMLHRFQRQRQKLRMTKQHDGKTGYKSTQPSMGFIHSATNITTEFEFSPHPAMLQILETVNSFSMHDGLYTNPDSRCMVWITLEC
jgi:hypothetical protein